MSQGFLDPAVRAGHETTCKGRSDAGVWACCPLLMTVKDGTTRRRSRLEKGYEKLRESKKLGKVRETDNGRRGSRGKAVELPRWGL